MALALAVPSPTVPRRYGPVAQGIEQWFPVPCVGGSNPSRPASFSPHKRGSVGISPSGLYSTTATPTATGRGSFAEKEGKRGGFGLPSQGRVVGGTVQDPDPRRT